MAKINFRADIWELINKLSKINNEIVIQKAKNGDNVIAMNNNTMGVLLTMDKSMFEYDEEIIFTNYKDFYTILNTIGDYTIDIDKNKMITLTTKNISVKFITGYDEMLSPGSKGPINFKYGDEGAKFSICEADLTEIQTLIKLLIDKDTNKSESSSTISSKAVMTVEGSRITIEFMNTGGTLDSNYTGNSFIRLFDNLVENKNNDKYVYEINPDFFLGLPNKSDYTISLKPKDSETKMVKAETTFKKNDENNNEQVIGECVFLTGVYVYR